MPHQQQPNNALTVLLLIAIGLLLFGQGGGGNSPIKTPGALYIEETGERGSLPDDQQGIFTANSRDSIKAWYALNFPMTHNTPDVRFIDQDADMSRDLPMFAEIKKLWEADGRPLPWRFVTDGRSFFQGTPTSASDELAKLQSLK